MAPGNYGIYVWLPTFRAARLIFVPKFVFGASPETGDMGFSCFFWLVNLPMRSSTFNVFGLATRRGAVGRYAEFLQAPTLHAGLYELEAGSEDKQQPHDDDEIYYVISGRASFFVEENSRPVQPGDVIYVAAGEAHRFEDIEEDLKLLVVFGPPARGVPPD